MSRTVLIRLVASFAALGAGVAAIVVVILLIQDTIG
jgi:hypothetical protein